MVRIFNETKATEVATAARRAKWPWQRMRGLLGRGSLPRGEGMIFARTGAVHTYFMRFPIDIVFLDETGAVLKTSENLPPFRVAGARGAHWCVELPAGTVSDSDTEPGDRLLFS